ncbi:MAG: hypothetical protein HY602_00775 [Parcubacteria group bacterium]|nr:hypothetical protein [Parcubacteria group bacterium]
MSEICSQCNIGRRVETDYSFIPQQTTEGRKVFCSTECLKNFWLDPANVAKIVLEVDPDKITFENASRARLMAMQELGVNEEEWHKKIHEPRGSNVRSELVHIQLRYEAAMNRKRWKKADGIPPRVCAICRPNGQEYFDLAPIMGSYVCSVEHIRQYLEQVEPFDCKCYWQKPERTRCRQCGLVARTDDHSNVGCGPIVLNPNTWSDGIGPIHLEGHAAPNQKLLFCSPGCCAVYLKTAKQPVIHWITTCGEVTCAECDARTTKVFAMGGPYGSDLDDLNGPTYVCSPQCAISLLEADEKQRLAYGYSSWFTGRFRGPFVQLPWRT